MTDKPKKKRTRRGNGEGTIFQRSDGHWTATISLGYDGNGKRVRRAVHGATKAEALDKLARLQNQRVSGTLPEKCRTKLAEYCTHWLETVVKPNSSDSTYTTYETRCRLNIVPLIGGVRLDNLTPLHISGLLADMERRGDSSSLRQFTYTVLRLMLKRALKDGLIARNPTDNVDRPRHRPGEIRPMTVDEVATFMAATKSSPYHTFWGLALHTGARRGELVALRWEDVDFEARVIRIRRTATFTRGRLKIKEPKTTKSRRQIELSNDAVQLLLDRRKEMLRRGFASVPWVFCGETQEPIQFSTLHYAFKSDLKAADLPQTFRIHDLRHTHASLLLQANLSVKMIQERLGHSKISITLDVYAHCIPTMQQEAAAKFDSILATGKPMKKQAKASG